MKYKVRQIKILNAKKRNLLKKNDLVLAYIGDGFQKEVGTYQGKGISKHILLNIKGVLFDTPHENIIKKLHKNNFPEYFL